MPLEARRHMVSFRLTREEHDRFRELCHANGHPSISEMARLAVKMMFGDLRRTRSEIVESRLTELETRVPFLFAEIQKLTHAKPSEAPVLAVRSDPQC